MSMHFSFDTPGPDGDRGPARPADDERPFRILVIADFSGRRSRHAVGPLADRPIHPVDLDTLDTLPGTLNTAIRVRTEPVVDVPVASIDDLHPDAIHDQAELFAALRGLRKKAQDPATFKQAAHDVSGWATGHTALGSQIEPKPAATATPESEFAALLGGSVGRAPKRAAANIDALLKQIIGPYIVPDRDPRQDELIAVINEAIAREMRELLHSPAWAQTEAAWRGLQTLVTGLELDEQLQLYALDASPDELNASAADLEHAIVTRPTQTAGGVPFSLILHLCVHDASTLPGLRSLAALARRAGAPLISSVDHATAGVASWDGVPDTEHWTEPDRALAALRQDAAAEAICLTLPRYLARLPYAPGYDPIDRFDFDETDGTPHHDRLLWGSGAVLAGLLLGRAFSAAGWNVRPVGAGSVEDLPVVTTPAAHGSPRDAAMVPCAEAWLSDRLAAELVARGLTPLVSVQNRGAVHVGPLQSLAGTPLPCGW